MDYYGCTKCQRPHFEDEPIYQEHILHQSKHGTAQAAGHLMESRAEYKVNERGRFRGRIRRQKA